MGRRYRQLSLDDRCEIARLHSGGASIRQIAAALDRPPSTIARELKRNSGREAGYKPGYAQEQSRARRWQGSRLERESGLRQSVLDRLAQGWSPEQIAGRLAREAGHKVISHESIYRFVYAQMARYKDYRWRHYLPRGKSKRGLRGRRGGSSASFIEGRIPLSERPPDAAGRKVPGHWEADLMLFSKYGQAVLTVHERQSRLLIALRPSDKKADRIARHLGIEGGTGGEEEDLLLRPLRALAERRHRERHRPHAPLHPAQDRSRNVAERSLPDPRRCLQQHPAQVP